MKKSTLSAVSLLAISMLGAGGLFAVHVRNALRKAKASVTREHAIVFELRDLSSPPHTALIGLPMPETYTAAAQINGRFYMAGPAGITEFSSPDTPSRAWHTGADLPPFPITSLSAGQLRGSPSAVLVATMRGRDAGVMLLDGTSIRRLTLTPAHEITAALPLPSGDLLLATHDAGLLRFDGHQISAFHPRTNNLQITALAGNDGDLWIGTRNHGVLHWHAGEVDTFDTQNGMPDAEVESIAVQGSTAYVGTPVGVQEFKDGRPARTLAPGTFAHAVALQDGTLLIAALDQGLQEVPLSASHVSKNIRNDATIESFYQTPDTIYAIARSGLLRRTGPGHWENMVSTPAASLADRNVSALQFAPDGRLWIGYFDHGMDILSPNEQHAQHIEDDHVFCVNRILFDTHRGTMDIATANGLALFDITGRQRQVLLRKDGLIADHVTDIALLNDGMAVATPAGLTYSDAQGMQSLYAFQGLVNNHVYTLSADPQTGKLLAGTLGGISLLEHKAVVKNISNANSGLKQNWITAIAQLDDRWLIGTYGASVMEMDAHGAISAIDIPSPHSIINPNAMLVTPTHVFAGTLTDGILLYNRGSRHWRNLKEGLPSLNVTAFAQKNGQIYIGTENGIVKVQEASLGE